MGGAEIQNEGERVNSSKRKSPFPGWGGKNSKREREMETDTS